MEGKIRGRGRNKRFWTPGEDEVLLQSLLEISQNPKWKSENGFKGGFTKRLEEMLIEKMPGCDLKATPHIESRLKHWSEKYCAVAEMLTISGFGWDDEKKVVQVERSVYDEWVKTHSKAKGLYGVPFPHYELLAEIYGKDRATGAASESFAQAAHNIDEDLARDTITLDSDDDNGGDEAEAESESLHSTSSSRKRKDPPSVRSEKRSRIQSKKSENVVDLASSFHSASDKISKAFEDMNANLVAMAQVWTSEEERKKKFEEDSNKILEEVLKLELSASDTLEVATILMAEEHKLRIFYQATTALKKHYVTDLLKKK